MAKDLALIGDGPIVTILEAAPEPGVADSRVISIARDTSVSVSGMTIRHGNVQPEGGGGIDNWGTLELTNSIVTSNRAIGPGNIGGGLNNHAGSLTITDSTVSGNTAEDSGGGIYNASGAITVVNSTLSGNRAVVAPGGGIYNLTGEVESLNSTISDNNAGDGGGGIWQGEMGTRGTLNLKNTTVTNNTAARGGGLNNNVHQNTGIANLVNSIISGNHAATGGDCFPEGITSLGHNLDSDGSCGFTEIGDVSAADPLLGPLTG